MTKRPLNFRFGAEHRGILRPSFWSLILLCCAATVRAGYKVEVQVDTAPGTNRYTWRVHNEDQSWGLDQFVIEVPVQTRVLTFTVPPPYSNPDGNARWIMQERQQPWLDAHDGRVISPSPRVGWKWLHWGGLESPSVYPHLVSTIKPAPLRLN